MKKYTGLVLVLGMVSAVSAFAHGNWLNPPLPQPSDSWDSIRANRNVGIVQPAGYTAFGWPGFFDSCVDGANIRSLTQKPVCVETKWVHTGGGQETGNDEQVCVRYENQYISIPINSTAQVCSQYTYQHVGGGQETGDDIATCVAYKTVNITIPTSPELSVVRYFSSGGQETGGDVTTQVLFKKVYDIPACN